MDDLPEKATLRCQAKSQKALPSVLSECLLPDAGKGGFSEEYEALHRHIPLSSRRFPDAAGLPVRSIGYFPVKRPWVCRTFKVLSFSFLFQGTGEYRRGAEKWPARSPCVLVQYPGAPLEYGPWETWEELYVTYAPDLLPRFAARGLFQTERPVWDIRNVTTVRRLAQELLEELKLGDPVACPDRIDHLCEGLLLESLLGRVLRPANRRDRAVLAVRSYLEQHYREPVNPDDVAVKQGLSPSDFRQRWSALMRVPPGRFVTELRLRRACRLLAETDMDIGEIALEIGYSDPLYFSRRFRQFMGEAASSYRRRTPQVSPK